MLTTYHKYCATVTKSGNLKFLGPFGPVQAFNGTALPFTATGLYITHHKNLYIDHLLFYLCTGTIVIVLITVKCYVKCNEQFSSVTGFLEMQPLG
jgi:hypothetical protein